jgi:hypothetical protein
MTQAIVIVNSEVKESGKSIAISPVTEKMVAALKQAILSHSPTAKIEIVSVAALWSKTVKLPSPNSETIYCPLTIQLPHWLEFPARDIYHACRDIEQRRQWVEQNLAYKTSIKDAWLGDLWLPVVLTAKKTLYAEIIGEGAMPNFYEQPVNLANDLRQPLYHLAEQVLKSLSAPPAVYLLQFSLIGKEIVFDRLWPFPAAPALASIKGQQPDLFACHWQCLLGKPIKEIVPIQSA